MRKISLVNQKGGCGKTTTAINLASCLAWESNRVLLIDLDPQGHSGLGLGVKPEQVEDSTYEVLVGEIPIRKSIHTLSHNLHAVFSNVVLSAFEQLMSGAPEREYKLAQSLADADIDDNYDYVIIDSPPSVGLLTFNALMASDEVIVPVDPSFFSLNGLDKLLETIQLIEEKAGHRLPFKILATNIDRRTNFGKGVVEKLKGHFGRNCFDTIINTCTRLREAASHGKPIDAYDKHCAAFRDYQSLTKEIIEEAPKKAKTLAPAFHLVDQGGLTGPTEKEILFTLEAPDYAMVQIAGDFNNWVPEHLNFTELNGRPVWQRTMQLKPGTYQYKYLVGSHWTHDFENDKTVDDFFGGVNSVIDV
jgi:chromosome partitioning protein